MQHVMAATAQNRDWLRGCNFQADKKSFASLRLDRVLPGSYSARSDRVKSKCLAMPTYSSAFRGTAGRGMTRTENLLELRRFSWFRNDACFSNLSKSETFTA